MDLRSRQTRRLTQTGSIDTGPCYSPDGRRIVFESDRDGSQQLYVMGADGSGQRRILRRGALLDAGVVAARRPHRLHQTNERQLPDRRHALGRVGRAHPHRGVPQRGPTWSPNGRVLMFFRESRGGGAGPSSSPSISPATTSALSRRRPSAPTRPGRRCEIDLRLYAALIALVCSRG